MGHHVLTHMFMNVCCPIPAGCQWACQESPLPLTQLFTGCTHLSGCGHIEAGGAGVRRCGCHSDHIEFSTFVKVLLYSSSAADLDLEENLQSSEGQSHM